MAVLSLKIRQCIFCQTKPTVRVMHHINLEGMKEARYVCICKCGAHGHFKKTKREAVDSWNVPWQHKAD